MNDDTLRRQLQQVQGDDPSPDFVDDLRRRLSQGSQRTGRAAADLEPGADPQQREPVTVIGIDPQPFPERRSRIMWPLAAAAGLLIGMLLVLQAVTGDDPDLDTAAATEAREIGEAWLTSIIEADREAFRALHGPDLVADDTLMGFSEDTALLTPARVSEVYGAGFDAFQAAVAIDDDVVAPQGCEDISEGVVRCVVTATMIGTDEYSYTIIADLTVTDRLISAIDFSTTTSPADFRSAIQGFLDQEATDEDRACLALGFNTVGCGEHESDFIARYAAYYEAVRPAPDS